MNVTIPGQVVLASRDHQLHCQVDLETDLLYSLKWYMNGTEVVSWMPLKAPSQQLEIYPLDGLHFDTLRTVTGQTVHLKQISLLSEGEWKCEVSAEGHFQTQEQHRFMQVIGKYCLSLSLEKHSSSTKNVHLSSSSHAQHSLICKTMVKKISCLERKLRCKRAGQLIVIAFKFASCTDTGSWVSCTSWQESVNGKS